KVLKNINKRINLEQVIRSVSWTKKAGIECRLAFMVGSPGDNEEIVKKNIKFVKKVNPDYLIVNITTPFPGTALFNWAKERKLILTYNWDDYNFTKPVMRLENLDAEEIRELYTKMFRSFYFSPSYVIKKLFTIRSFEDIKTGLSGFYALLYFFKRPARKKRNEKNEIAAPTLTVSGS
ncbi:hypothetical protein ACFL52_02815, partial [Candidatus Margulisiibacteriota bacterium]